MIIVSTDGSCLRNPGGAIGWAWVNHAGGSASGGAPSGTNQIAELRALLEAIRAHPSSEPLFIESDSLYAIKCASEWINGWRRNGWKTSTGGPVKNLELIQQIDQAINTRPGPVRFRWVRGHVGNYFNEQADTLCGQAARAIASGALDPAPDLTPSEPATEPIPLEPTTEPIPVITPAESVAATTEKVVAQAHTAAATPRRRVAATKTPAPDALTLF
ncbi:ribonuclease HI [Nocardia sp. SYP-A9097]|uniref:ribonuclease H family protein n=1 Tax=Nocardia sp. SYP-A9097 TaxID=2663237 RepID=UPI00129AD1BC|nr:ribonuclease H [Nocardia sp. SYP-A9097]MRH86351.1 ribonuclease HI [Nocardia sp. SYP-A9097]